MTTNDTMLHTPGDTADCGCTPTEACSRDCYYGATPLHLAFASVLHLLEQATSDDDGYCHPATVDHTGGGCMWIRQTIGDDGLHCVTITEGDGPLSVGDTPAGVDQYCVIVHPVDEYGEPDWEHPADRDGCGIVGFYVTPEQLPLLVRHLHTDPTCITDVTAMPAAFADCWFDPAF